MLHAAAGLTRCCLRHPCPLLLRAPAGEVQAAAGRQDRLPRASAAVHPGQEQVQHPQVPVRASGRQADPARASSLRSAPVRRCAIFAICCSGGCWQVLRAVMFAAGRRWRTRKGGGCAAGAQCWLAARQRGTLGAGHHWQGRLSSWSKSRSQQPRGSWQSWTELAARQAAAAKGSLQQHRRRSIIIARASNHYRGQPGCHIDEIRQPAPRWHSRRARQP